MSSAWPLLRSQCRRRSLPQRRGRHSLSPRAIDGFAAADLDAAAKDPVFPIVISDDGSHALRRRRGDNRPLPLPPHMDPIRRAQRNRWKTTKAAPLKYEQMSEFQKALWNNPYARALATPVRQCRPTNVRMPSFFLLPFQVERRPVLPNDPNPKSSHCLVPRRLFDEADGKPQKAPHSQTYSAASQRMVDYLPKKLKSGKPPWVALLDWQTKQDLGSKISWQDDMAERILEAMRDALLKELKHHLAPGFEVSSTVPYADQSEIDGQIGAVLYLSQADPVPESANRVANVEPQDAQTGPLVDRLGESIETANQELQDLDARWAKIYRTALTMEFGNSPSRAHLPPGANSRALIPQLKPELRHPPVRYSTMTIDGNTVPVYKLWPLLGEAKLKQALSGTSLEQEAAAVVLHSAATVKLEMGLLRLQNYLAEP